MFGLGKKKEEQKVQPPTPPQGEQQSSDSNLPSMDLPDLDLPELDASFTTPDSQELPELPELPTQQSEEKKEPTSVPQIKPAVEETPQMEAPKVETPKEPIVTKEEPSFDAPDIDALLAQVDENVDSQSEKPKEKKNTVSQDELDMDEPKAPATQANIVDDTPIPSKISPINTHVSSNFAFCEMHEFQEVLTDLSIMKKEVHDIGAYFSSMNDTQATLDKEYDSYKSQIKNSFSIIRQIEQTLFEVKL